MVRAKTNVGTKTKAKEKKVRKFRIVMPFTYKGPKGNWKPKEHRRLGPGQEFPKLESGEI